jgi:hypothetical protein
MPAFGYQPVTSFKARMGEATPLLQTPYTYCLSRRRHYESLQEIRTPRNTMATAAATARRRLPKRLQETAQKAVVEALQIPPSRRNTKTYAYSRL